MPAVDACNHDRCACRLHRSLLLKSAAITQVEVSARRSVYCYDDAELQELLTTLGEGAKPAIQRFKGLGEMMPEQLWSTTLDPATRTLRRLTIEDAAEASHMFALLMGDKVGPRRELIEQYAGSMQLQELDI